jgi:hypothetical protein
MLVCAAGFIGMGLFATSAWAFCSVALVEIGIGRVRPMFWTVPPLFLSRSAMAGAIALISVFANFGGIIGPVVIGWLKTTTDSFSGGLYYVACYAFRPRSPSRCCAPKRGWCRRRGDGHTTYRNRVVRHPNRLYTFDAASRTG